MDSDSDSIVKDLDSDSDSARAGLVTGLAISHCAFKVINYF